MITAAKVCRTARGAIQRGYALRGLSHLIYLCARYIGADGRKVVAGIRHSRVILQGRRLPASICIGSFQKRLPVFLPFSPPRYLCPRCQGSLMDNWQGEMSGSYGRTSTSHSAFAALEKLRGLSHFSIFAVPTHRLNRVVDR